MAEAAQGAAEEGTRRFKDVSSQAADAGQHAVNATAKAARVGAETLQQTLQAGWEAVSRVAQRSTDIFMQVLGLSWRQSEELAQQSSQNIQAIANTSIALLTCHKHPPHAHFHRI
jgi:hypothetical protein